jgi:hypothetical protein
MRKLVTLAKLEIEYRNLFAEWVAREMPTWPPAETTHLDPQWRHPMAKRGSAEK